MTIQLTKEDIDSFKNYKNSFLGSLSSTNGFAYNLDILYKNVYKHDIDLSNSESLRQAAYSAAALKIFYSIDTIDLNQADAKDWMNIADNLHEALKITKLKEGIVNVGGVFSSKTNKATIVSAEYIKEQGLNEDITKQIFIKLTVKEKEQFLQKAGIALFTPEGLEYVRKSIQDDKIKASLQNQNTKAKQASKQNILDKKPAQGKAEIKLEPLSQGKLQEIQEFKNTAAAWQSIGSEFEKIGKYNDNEELSKIGAGIGSAVTAALGYSTFAAGSGVLAASGFGMAASGAVAIFSLLTSKKKRNDGLGKSLAQIQESLNIINQKVNQLHNEIFEVYRFLQYHHQDMSMRLDSLDKLSRSGITELSNLIKTDLFVEISRITNNIESEILPRDAGEFRKDLNIIDSFATSLSKSSSLSGANLKANSILEIETQNQLSLRPSPIDNIAFYVNYAKDILGIEKLPKGEEIPNLDLFYKMCQAFLNMVVQAIESDLSANNPKEKFIDKSNADYIYNVLGRLNAMNSQINDTVNLLREGAPKKLINQYQLQVNETSSYVQLEMKNYSDKLGFEGIKDDYSIFYPDYEKIKEIRQGEHQYYGQCVPNIIIPFGNQEVRPSLGIDFSTSDYWLKEWKCKEKIKWIFNNNPKNSILVPSTACIHATRHRDGYCYDTKIKVSITVAPEKLESIQNQINTTALNKLSEYRSSFFDDLKEQPKYTDHLNKLTMYENLVNIYAKITGGDLVVDFAKQTNTSVYELTQKPSNETILTLNDYVNNTIIEDAYKNWTLSSNTYKDYANFYQARINVTLSLLNLLDEMEAKKVEEVLAEKIDKTYSELKAFFNELFKLSDYFRGGLTNKPADLEKFNLLLDQITIDQAPEDLNQLKDNYCEIFCLDRHLKISSELYRDVMKDDPHMGYFVGEMKELNNGEVQFCYC